MNQKQSKKGITDIDKSKDEIFSAIPALVVDIYQRTQTEKTLFFIKYSKETTIKKIYQTTFFSLCSLTYINNQSICDTKNFTVSFIDTFYCCCRFFCSINMNIKYNSKICRIIIMCCDK